MRSRAVDARPSTERVRIFPWSAEALTDCLTGQKEILLLTRRTAGLRAPSNGQPPLTQYQQLRLAFGARLFTAGVPTATNRDNRDKLRELFCRGCVLSGLSLRR